MALDYMAIVSNGAYPTPTPTASQRTAYAISYGLLGVVATVATTGREFIGSLFIGVFQNIMQKVFWPNT